MDNRISIPHSPILQNKEQDELLHQNGYVVFPFLDEQEVSRLTEHYHSNHKQSPEYFYASTHVPDKNFRRETSEFILNLLQPKLPVFFERFQALGGAFVVKPGKGKGILAPHQDWNIVDEKKYRSYNLWIPLVDVTTENGAVAVLAGSHARNESFRGPNIPSPFGAIEQQVWNSLTPLPMKAGEVLFYDHALIHASPVNQSENLRLGVVLGLIPDEASMQLYYGSKGNVELYACNRDFYLNHDPDDAPQVLEKLDTFSMNTGGFTIDDYNRIYLGKNKQNLLSKLFRFSGK